MTQALSLPIVETHSSDLTCACPRAAKLRRDGKVNKVGTEALFRGIVAGWALRFIHERALWGSPADVIDEAMHESMKQLSEEERPPSVAVSRKLDEIRDEVKVMTGYYAMRLSSRFAAAKLLGCEVPIRFDLIVDGIATPFASHIDLLYRLNGGLIFADWKWRDESPTWQYLARNEQFGMYHLGILEGSVLVNGDWIEFGEHADGEWIHLPNLFPYKRAATVRDDGGEQIQVKKGDPRPLNAILRSVPYDESSTERIKQELTTRVRMERAGLWPTRPDPVGCSLCESAQWCESFTA